VLIAMKAKIIIIALALMFAPDLVSAQDMSIHENDTAGMIEKTNNPQSEADHFMQVAYVASLDKSILEVTAIAARKKFTSEPTLYTELKQSNNLAGGLIDEWRVQVYKILSTYSIPRQANIVNDYRLQSNNELDEQTDTNRTLTKIILKETVKFTQERLPEIDRLIKALRFEVSTDMISKEIREVEANDQKTDGPKKEHHPFVKDKLFAKTGFHVPVESGKFRLVSETEARYGNMSSFFKIYLDGQLDNSLGLIYDFNRATQLQIQRHDTHGADPRTSEKRSAKSNLNLIQLVCRF
jgi:hypothetical protein